MKERRSLERLKPYYYLRVYDERNENYVGSVMDISLKGFRLMSETPFDARINYRLVMRLPEESFFGSLVRIPAICRWSKPSNGGGSFEAGFEFEGLIDDGIHTIRALVRDLQDRKQM